MPTASSAAPACTTPPATRGREPAAAPRAATDPCANTVSCGGRNTFGFATRGLFSKFYPESRSGGQRRHPLQSDAWLGAPMGSSFLPGVRSEPFPGSRSSRRKVISILCVRPLDTEVPFQGSRARTSPPRSLGLGSRAKASEPNRCALQPRLAAENNRMRLGASRKERLAASLWWADGGFAAEAV